MLLANPQDCIGAAEEDNPAILPLNLDIVVGLPHGLLLVAVHHLVRRHEDSRRRRAIMHRRGCVMTGSVMSLAAVPGYLALTLLYRHTYLYLVASSEYLCQ